MDLVKEVGEIEREIIAIRRDLHEYPEISMQEERTANVVIDYLQSLNIDYEIVENGGIIGTLVGSSEGKTIALRADLDALPMKESPTNLRMDKVVVSKTEEAAHLCGHDGHTAMLLGAANVLSKHREQIKGKILFVFERGEEDGRGIYRMLERLVHIGVDGIWGIHLKSDIPSGKISVDPGPRMAGVFPFHIRIRGKSGHGSRPDLAHSPIDCFTHFYTQLKTVKHDTLDPFMPITYYIGHLHSGSVANAIPDELSFRGTARYLHAEQGRHLKRVFDDLLEKSCDLYHCSYEYVEQTKPIDLLVYNEETCAEIALKSIETSIGEDVIFEYPAWLASEPFGLYQKYFPGVFAFVGIKNEQKGTGAEHHNAHFDLDEDVLKLGTVATIQYALDFLEKNPSISYEAETRDVAALFEHIGLPIP